MSRHAQSKTSINIPPHTSFSLFDRNFETLPSHLLSSRITRQWLNFCTMAPKEPELETSPELLANRFISSQATHNWSSYSKAGCKLGSRLTVSWEHLGRLLISLGDVGWIPLMDLRGDMYPHLMREFYYNLEQTYTGNNPRRYTIQSSVQNCDITLTMSLLARLLEIPNERDYGYCLHYNNIDDAFGDAKAFYNSLADHPPNRQSLYTCDLKLENDVLFYCVFIRHNIIPTIWRKDQVLPIESMYMEAICSRCKVNVAYTILCHMYQTTQRNPIGELPYENFLNNIF